MAMDPYNAVGAGYVAANKPLGMTPKVFDENARGAVRSSDITVSAVKIKSAATGVVALATVPEGENWRIEYLSARNHTGGSTTLAIFLVPSGGSPVVANNAVFQGSLATATTKICDEAIGYQLLPGERLMMACSVDNDVIAFARLRRITQGET